MKTGGTTLLSYGASDGRKGEPMKRDELMKDLEFCENAMIRLGDRSDIWQDRMIYGILKVLRDILIAMIKGQTNGTTPTKL